MTISLLLIDDHPSQAALFEDMIHESENIEWDIVMVSYLHEALQTLEERHFDVIIVDLALPDSFGLETFLKIKAKAPSTPIIILTVLAARSLAYEAIRQGAQDYLVEGQFSSSLLIRSINYAIERQRIKEELKQQIARERLMGRMIERIRQSLQLNQILTVTVEEVRQFLNTDQVLIYRCEDQYQGTIMAESRSPDHEKRQNRRFESALEFITQLSSPLESIGGENLQDPKIDDWIETLVNSLLTVPIWQTQESQPYRLWGQLIAYDYSGNRQWQQWEMEFLKQLANQVAIAINQSELYETLTRLANQDGLTGLANRRQLDLTLQREWQRMAREGSPLSLVMCDVDFFGRYNHALGYLAGDDCLKTLAQILQNVCQRSSDVAARYGGEEFLLILPNTDANGALTVAQNLQRQLAEAHLPHPESTVSPFVTLSIGVASQIPQLIQDPLILLDQAAHAVQQAKENRNCIVQFLPPQPDTI